ncbi:RusA family crossover junction endodeoxyribonuclease [Acetobacter syzygii]|uniref:RusA family crossover junction endodeoxyribonuclease n=1 Tax=Acetobacter syzygii TaxID=146476 RepID=UPI0020C5B44D|nr:RusA family crossover junction endodeoxyribonuclease [Acetobacter syzygii]
METTASEQPIYRIIIPGLLRAKGRPRFGNGRTFTDAKTVQAEKYIQRHAIEQIGMPCLSGPLHVSLTINIAPPPSWSRKKGANTLVWKAATRDMNPEFDEQEERDAYEEDPAAAAAEYGAEFRSDIASFVAPEVVEACTVQGRHELPRDSRVRYVAFVDPSGGSSDSMTLAIAHHENDCTVLDLVRERKAPFSPEATVSDFASVLKSYGLSSVTGDRYGGEWPREQFRKHGIAYNLSDKPRSDLYRDLLPLLNSGKAELLDIPVLSRQLCGLERRTGRSGKDNIDHAPGGHDDVANAVAGVLLMQSARRMPKFTPAMVQKIAEQGKRESFSVWAR